MIEDVHQLRESAEAQIRAGQVAQGIETLLRALAQTHVSEKDYVALLAPLARAFEKVGATRSALSVYWYDAAATGRATSLLPHVPPEDRARTFASLGKLKEAADEMESVGRIAAAAIYREQAGDHRSARALWARLSRSTFSAADAYNAALVHFNLARMAKKCDDANQAREAIVASVRLLEEAADHFESVGQRERAFDCFQVLVQVGRESGMFEDVLEGYVNCIRILREDHLKYFALQYYDDALGQAEKRNEISAAATLAREAAEYARAIGMSEVGVFYMRRQAELWKRAATQKLDQGAPPELAENALLASVLAYGEAGSFRDVGAAYESLATLELEQSRKSHYLRAAERYREIPLDRFEVTNLPAYLKHDHHFPDVWHVDLLEWEERGSAEETCAGVLLHRKWPELIRRKALIARLTALVVEDPKRRVESGIKQRLAMELAQIQLFAVLSPLERLFEQSETAVKIAVLGAMRTLFFKRTFVTIRAALRESVPGIIEQASHTIEALYFQHAFDPLARLVREEVQPQVRASAIRALSRVDTAEAAEFLFGLLGHGTPKDREWTMGALKQARGMRFIEVARAMMTDSPPDLQARLREVLQARGV